MTKHERRRTLTCRLGPKILITTLVKGCLFPSKCLLERIPYRRHQNKRFDQTFSVNSTPESTRTIQLCLLNCLAPYRSICLKSNQARQEQNIEYFTTQFIPETKEPETKNKHTNKQIKQANIARLVLNKFDSKNFVMFHTNTITLVQSTQCSNSKQIIFN